MRYTAQVCDLTYYPDHALFDFGIGRGDSFRTGRPREKANVANGDEGGQESEDEEIAFWR